MIRIKFLRRRKKIFFIRRVRLQLSVVIFCIFLTLVLLFEYANKQIFPTVIVLAEAKAKSISLQFATGIVNKRLDEINYSDLVHIQKDSDEKVTALQANIVKMNKLSAEIALELQKEMSELDDINIKIPLWNIFGNTFFSNQGPEIMVKAVPYGNIDVDFGTEFISAGINQTRHRIFIQIRTKMIVAVPLAKKGTDFIIKIPVAETVIVGEVPESFINLEKNNTN